MELRNYQKDCIESLWSSLCVHHTALCVLSTGSGKTFIFSHFIKKAIAAKPDIKIAIIMGRVDLVEQTEKALYQVIPRNGIGVYCKSLNRKELSRTVTVASIHSVKNINFPKTNLLIIDEVHNLDQKAGSYLNFIEKRQNENFKLKILGFTATPYRSDGLIYGEDKLFKKIDYEKPIQEMIFEGYLSKPVLQGSTNSFDTSKLRIRAGEFRQEDVDQLVSDEDRCELQVRDALSRLKDRACVAWATANIEHCTRITNIIQRLGERVTCVHSKQSKDVRNTNLAQFKGGAVKHMVFVSILSEGFDHKYIDAVVLMRPTQSPVLYIQTVGRGLRIAPNKNDCLVLDYGEVIQRLGPIDQVSISSGKKGGEAPVKLCPKCMSYVPSGCLECPECQHQFPPRVKIEEKITERPDTKAAILSIEQQPVTYKMGPLVMDMYESKSGNVCVRITYKDKNLLSKWGGICEYFVTHSPWALQKLEARLKFLGLEMPKLPLDSELIVDGTFEVTKIKDNKYDRVISVKKISTELPKDSWMEMLEG